MKIVANVKTKKLIGSQICWAGAIVLYLLSSHAAARQADDKPPPGPEEALPTSPEITPRPQPQPEYTPPQLFQPDLRNEPPATSGGAVRYRECTETIAVDPQRALDDALGWWESGGGVTARHCVALALFEAERYARAAEIFVEVGDDIRAGRGLFDIGLTITPQLVAEIYGQGGNAWLLANDPNNAYSSFSAGLAGVEPTSATAFNLLIDRARASAAVRDYPAAVKDLESAQIIDPTAAVVYLFLSSAHRLAGDIPAAQAAIDEAARLAPSDPDILLERANTRAAGGDIDAAKQDWLTLVGRFPESLAAKSARINLERTTKINLENEEKASPR
ncbi:MAG: hypothetical protein AAGF15_06610 [Pseudomonadota bacterium]